jgi:DNA-binding response OmpR family regulator
MHEGERIAMSTAKQRILVVEDEAAILLGLVENLKFAGYEVISATDGETGLRLAMNESPALIVLDIMLPGISGYEICRKLREANRRMPILMLTARQDEFDKVHGFEMGADDYVTKPFSINELLSRIKAILLRGERRADVAHLYTFGEYELDIDARIFRKNGKEISLTHTEFDLLAYFCRHEGKALSRDKIMADVWGTEYYGTQRSLDSFVSNLRQKIEGHKARRRYIHTVHGIGYKFLSA